ncbi:MAG: inositol monophosphatase family protein, partial [Actinomycetota bacterium]|nr:inositol monophosphatase family protein [Actinomycetota bacterium]
MTADDWLELLQQTATAVQRSLDTFDGWTEGGDRPDQYLLDQVADSAALTVLNSVDATVLSEESGLVSGTTSETVIIDPVDGSTNASRRIPHYCTSLCVVDGQGPLVGLVLNLANGEQFQAVRGQGAFLDGEQIQPTQCTKLNEAVIGIAGNPPKPIGARQFRAF